MSTTRRQLDVQLPPTGTVDDALLIQQEYHHIEPLYWTTILKHYIEALYWSLSTLKSWRHLLTRGEDAD